MAIINSAKEAYNCYKVSVLKDLAERYRGTIDVRLYELLADFPLKRL